jgi:hypothetical protein
MSSTTMFVVGSSHILLFIDASLPLLFHSLNIVIFWHPHALFFLSYTDGNFFVSALAATA